MPVRSLIFLFFVLILPLPLAAQITLIANTAVAVTSGGTSSAINVAGANFIQIQAYYTDTCSDSAGNTYSQLFVGSGGYGGTNAQILGVFNPTTSSSLTVTCSGHPFVVTAWSGVASVDHVLQTTSVNSYPIPIGPLTPTNSDELIYGAFTGTYLSSPPADLSVSFSNMTNITPNGQVQPGLGEAGAYVIQTTATALSTNITMNQQNGGNGFLIAYFSTADPAPLLVTSTSPFAEGAVGTAYVGVPSENGPYRTLRLT